jgi:hypothetical protein
MDSKRSSSEPNEDSELDRQNIERIRRAFPNYGQENPRYDINDFNRSRKRQVLVGWILFAIGSLFILAYIGFLVYYVLYAIGHFEEIDAFFGILLPVTPLVIVIPLFFVARTGWIQSHSKSKPLDSHQGKYDTSEKAVIIIETMGSKVLFFTPTRIVVACTDGLYGLGLLYSLPPGQVLMLDSRNYEIPYTNIQNVKIFSSFPGPLMQITSTAIRSQPEKTGRDSHIYQFTLEQSFQWQRYENILKELLPENTTIGIRN